MYRAVIDHGILETLRIGNTLNSEHMDEGDEYEYDDDFETLSWIWFEVTLYNYM